MDKERKMLLEWRGGGYAEEEKERSYHRAEKSPPLAWLAEPPFL